MNLKIYLLLALLGAVLTSSCNTTNGALTGSDDTKAVVIEDNDFDKPAADKGGDVTPFDSDLNVGDENLVEDKKREEGNKKASDNSTISTMYDGMGNKTEVREFLSDALVQRVLIRTSTDGTTQLFVYAQNGQVKRIDGKSAGNMLNASASEIARAAQIYESRESFERKRDERKEARVREIQEAQMEQESVSPAPAARPTNVTPESVPAPTENQSGTEVSSNQDRSQTDKAAKPND